MEDEKKMWTRWKKPRPPREKYNPDLVLFATRVPSGVMKQFQDAVKMNGDKIQTIIKRFMEDYIKKTGDDGK